MISPKSNKFVNSVKIVLTENETNEAKQIVKSKGYTFQGWLGNLVRKEIEKNKLDLRANINLTDGYSNVETFRKD